MVPSNDKTMKSQRRALRNRGRFDSTRTKITLVLAIAAIPILLVQFVLIPRVLQKTWDSITYSYYEDIGDGLVHLLASVPEESGYAGLHAALDNYQRSQTRMIALAIKNPGGVVVASGFEPKLGTDDLDPLLESLSRADRSKKVTLAEPVALGQKYLYPVEIKYRLPDEGGTSAAPKEGTLVFGFLEFPFTPTMTSAVRFALFWDVTAVVLCILLVLLFARRLTQPLEQLAHAAQAIAQGDLTVSTGPEGTGEMRLLSQGFDKMKGELNSMVTRLLSTSQEVEAEVTNILSTSSQQSAMASQQSSAINETSATVTEIAQTSKQATEHADAVIQLALRSEELSHDGRRVVDESIEGLSKLSDQVNAIARSIMDLSERTLQIGDIMTTMKDLSEQSNLLALNASIEAAKAGEHGRGFAIVAMEMRNLAEQSKVAAGEVRAILSEVQKGTRAAVSATEEGNKRAQSAMDLARSAGSSIAGLAEVIRDSSLAARQIADNTRQQTLGVEQIVAAIEELSASMLEVHEGTRKIESVASGLTQVSRGLTEMVNRYQV